MMHDAEKQTFEEADLTSMVEEIAKQPGKKAAIQRRGEFVFITATEEFSWSTEVQAFRTMDSGALVRTMQVPHGVMETLANGE